MVRFTLYDTLAFLIFSLSLHDALPISTRPKMNWPMRRAFSMYSRSSRSRVTRDRKSTRLNSSHTVISYAVFCLKKKIIAAVIAYYVHPVNIQTACLIMEGAEFTENIIN